MAETTCRRIHNRFLSPTLIERAIKSLEDYDFYSDWVNFKSPGTDTLVISLNREEKPITISISESQDMDFEIRGDDETVKIFIKEMTAEVVSLAAAELCKCIHPSDDLDELKKEFRKTMTKAITSAFHSVE